MYPGNLMSGPHIFAEKSKTVMMTSNRENPLVCRPITLFQRFKDLPSCKT